MELLELFNFITEYFSGNKAFNLFIISIAVWMIIKIKIIRHPRFILRFITFIFMLILAFNSIYLRLVTNPLSIAILLVLLAVYALLAYKSAKKPILYSARKLDDLQNELRKGHNLNNEELFDTKPIYLIDSIENIQYLMLKAEHLRALQRFREAYEVYQSIDEEKLFDDEKNELLIKKAFLLYLLGDMNKAKHNLSYIQDKTEPNYLMLKALIEENAMNFEETSDLLKKALNFTADMNDTVLSAMVYNNYGRLRVIEGNYTDAISFYRQSYQIAKKKKSHELIHITFQNLIHTSIYMGDQDKAKHYFQEYEMLISENNLYDLMEKFNLRVEIARQNQSIIQISEIINEGYKKIRFLLPNQKKKIFDSSVLRMMYNSGVNLDNIMNRIYDNLNDYFELEMPEKYFVLKEIYIPLIEIQLPYCYKYALIRKRINEYMIKDASREIDIYVSSLKDYEVYQRCNMELQKVIIQKEYTKVYTFDSIYSLMADIRDIYQKNGIVIEALTMDLNIVDECLAIENYSNNIMKPVPRKKMKEHLETVVNNLPKLKQSPKTSEINIRLAIYYMALNENKKSEKYFEAFEKTKTPIHHFALWIQREYRTLCYQFKINSKLER